MYMCIYIMCMHVEFVYLIKKVGFVLVCKSLGSLGEIPRVALQWSGRNSMAPVSGCPWWCPICITR